MRVKVPSDTDEITMSKSWNCPLCSWFGAPTMKAIVRHIGAVHAQDAGFHVCCGIAGCPRTYSKFHSYRQHLYRHHREALDGISPDASAGVEDDQSGGCSDTISVGSDSPSDRDDHSPLSMKQAGLFLLKAKEIYKISQSNLESLIGDILTIVDLTVNHLEDKVRLELDSIGIGMNNELRQVFHSPQLSGIFQGLHTEFRLKKFIRENLKLVVSHGPLYILFFSMNITWWSKNVIHTETMFDYLHMAMYAW